MRRWWRTGGIVGATMALAAGGACFAAGVQTAAAASSLTFDCAAGTQSWTVPAGVTSATFDVRGAAGGLGDPGGGDSPGNVAGKGGAAVGTVAVTPGETLTVVVGCRGADGSSTPDGPAAGGTGYGDGGAGGVASNPAGGGGGGSAVLRGSTPLLAAGGGGASAPDQVAEGFGGDGGGANQPGLDGDSAPTWCPPGSGGEGAAVAGAGAGGTTPFPAFGNDGADGSGNDGGAGGDGPSGTSGAGGGGGFFGGGGGASSGNTTCGGGGGGSGYADPSVTDVSGSTGLQSGDGVVTVTFDAPPPTTTSTTTAPTTPTTSPTPAPDAAPVATAVVATPRFAG